MNERGSTKAGPSFKELQAQEAKYKKITPQSGSILRFINENRLPNNHPLFGLRRSLSGKDLTVIDVDETATRFTVAGEIQGISHSAPNWVLNTNNFKIIHTIH